VAAIPCRGPCRGVLLLKGARGGERVRGSEAEARYRIGMKAVQREIKDGFLRLGGAEGVVITVRVCTQEVKGISASVYEASGFLTNEKKESLSVSQPRLTRCAESKDEKKLSMGLRAFKEFLC
jgi:hypothetical protein